MVEAFSGVSTLAAAAALSAALAAPAMARAPDLTACKASSATDDGPGEGLQRTEPLAVPSALRHLIATDLSHMAVRTLAGGTLCLDTEYWNDISPPVLSGDERFISFDWSGYEAGGHILIDRSGPGSEHDTGAWPVASPNGSRLISVEWSDSGFGSLNGVLVLEKATVGMTELARLTDMPQGDDWKVRRWSGEDCAEISYVPWTDDSGATPRATTLAVSRRGTGWTLGAAGSTCPAA